MSKFSIGQMNQVGNAMEADGWDESIVSKFGQSGRFADFRAVIEGRAEIVINQVPKVVTTLLVSVKTASLRSTPRKNTASCFTAMERYYYRDPELDELLPEVQEAQEVGTIIGNQLTQNSRFLEMVQSLLSTEEANIATLSKLLIEKRQTVTLTQVEQLIELQEAGEDVGLLTNGYANFFLVVNKEGGVSVVHARRVGGRWRVRVYSLDLGHVWYAEYRVFSRN